MITENLSTLKIHKLTQAQYDRELSSGNIDTNALYLTPDEEIDLSDYATIEYVDSKVKAKAGFIYPLASSVIPEGFLLCDGMAYSRIEYPELFAAIGTMYGEGDGSTTFNVPSLSTRVPVGSGNGYTLGATGGEATHTLTVDEMPSHNHRPYNYNTAGSDTSYKRQFTTNLHTSSDSTARTQVASGSSGVYAMTATTASDITGVDYTTNTGGSAAHNNMQPYTVVNYIIATGKNSGVSVQDIIVGAQTLPLAVEYGGTGATDITTARANLGITNKTLTQHLSEEDMILSSHQYGTTLPDPGTPGRLFFLKASE